MKKTYYVYMMMNKWNTVLYTGVTNNLLRRFQEHKENIHDQSFTNQYNCNKLVYYEIADDIRNAIIREKEIKGWVREKKEALIDTLNPSRRDLSDELLGYAGDSSLRSE